MTRWNCGYRVSDLAYQKYSLYHNNGDATFAYLERQRGLVQGRSPFGWGMRFIDYDNDGRKDLLVRNPSDGSRVP